MIIDILLLTITNQLARHDQRLDGLWSMVPVRVPMPLPCMMCVLVCTVMQWCTGAGVTSVCGSRMHGRSSKFIWFTYLKSPKGKFKNMHIYLFLCDKIKGLHATPWKRRSPPGFQIIQASFHRHKPRGTRKELRMCRTCGFPVQNLNRGIGEGTLIVKISWSRHQQ